MFKIGDKVKLTRNGRTGVIERISDGIAIIRPDDSISHFTAEMLDRLEMAAIPALTDGSGSWMVSRRDTGEVVGEFFARQNVEAFDLNRVTVETARQYLERVNAAIKAGA